MSNNQMPLRTLYIGPVSLALGAVALALSRDLFSFDTELILATSISLSGLLYLLAESARCSAWRPFAELSVSDIVVVLSLLIISISPMIAVSILATFRDNSSKQSIITAEVCLAVFLIGLTTFAVTGTFNFNKQSEEPETIHRVALVLGTFSSFVLLGEAGQYKFVADVVSPTLVRLAYDLKFVTCGVVCLILISGTLIDTAQALKKPWAMIRQRFVDSRVFLSEWRAELSGGVAMVGRATIAGGTTFIIICIAVLAYIISAIITALYTTLINTFRGLTSRGIAIAICLNIAIYSGLRFVVSGERLFFYLQRVLALGVGQFALVMFFIWAVVWVIAVLVAVALSIEQVMANLLQGIPYATYFFLLTFWTVELFLVLISKFLGWNSLHGVSSPGLLFWIVPLSLIALAVLFLIHKKVEEV